MQQPLLYLQKFIFVKIYRIQPSNRREEQTDSSLPQLKALLHTPQIMTKTNSFPSTCYFLKLEFLSQFTAPARNTARRRRTPATPRPYSRDRYPFLFSTVLLPYVPPPPPPLCSFHAPTRSCYSFSLLHHSLYVLAGWSKLI